MGIGGEAIFDHRLTPRLMLIQIVAATENESLHGNDKTEPTTHYNSSSVSKSSGGRGAAPSKIIYFISVFLCFFTRNYSVLFSVFFFFFNIYVSSFF